MARESGLHWTKRPGSSRFCLHSATIRGVAKNIPREFSERNLENLQRWGHIRRSVYAPEFAEMFLFHSEHVQQSFESWCYCLVRKLAAVPRLFIYTRPPELWPNSHRSIEDFPRLKTFIQYSFELLRRASRGEAGHFLMFEAIQDSRYCSFHNTLCISNKIFSYLSENVIVRIEFMPLVCLFFLFPFFGRTSFFSHHSCFFLPHAAFQTKFN